MALSLGHTQINSKQGEPLRASIEIYSASPEELQGLGVQLFGQMDYQALGLSWDKSLASTRLDLIESKDGRLFVNIQGREALEQSFVELFFEMHWNSGQVNKQVGLLLDPVERKVGAALPQETSNKIVLVNRGDSASQLIKPYLPDDVSMDQMLLALVQSNPKSFVKGTSTACCLAARFKSLNASLPCGPARTRRKAKSGHKPKTSTLTGKPS